ncbi:MAG: class II fructose-bisphosphate aldolase, partial [Flavobacteriales bacterium]|nr:class II fructose-bisphosphate aldolase [Flavobacteriales bacterium]
NVVLTPKILDNSQKYIQEKFNTKNLPVDFVFHGGSGSSKKEITEAISYGVIKMNIDTDLQWGFTVGVRDYFNKFNDYLQSQIGNPEGSENPNKKYYDPRKFTREGELTFKSRLIKSFEDLNNINTIK